MRKKTCIKVITVSKKTNIEVFYVIYYFWLPSRNTACENEGGCVRSTFSCLHPFPGPCASPGTLREGAASVRLGTPLGMHVNTSLGTPIVGAQMADAAINRSPKLKGSAMEGGTCVRGMAVAVVVESSGWLRGMALAENIVCAEGMAAAESSMCARGMDARAWGASSSRKVCVCEGNGHARAREMAVVERGWGGTVMCARETVVAEDLMHARETAAWGGDVRIRGTGAGVSAVGGGGITEEWRPEKGQKKIVSCVP
jgi:hypothetical protein